MWKTILLLFTLLQTRLVMCGLHPYCVNCSSEKYKIICCYVESLCCESDTSSSHGISAHSLSTTQIFSNFTTEKTTTDLKNQTILNSSLSSELVTNPGYSNTIPNQNESSTVLNGSTNSHEIITNQFSIPTINGIENSTQTSPSIISIQSMMTSNNTSFPRPNSTTSIPEDVLINLTTKTSETNVTTSTSNTNTSQIMPLADILLPWRTTKITPTNTSAENVFNTSSSATPIISYSPTTNSPSTEINESSSQKSSMVTNSFSDSVGGNSSSKSTETVTPFYVVDTTITGIINNVTSTLSPSTPSKFNVENIPGLGNGEITTSNVHESSTPSVFHVENIPGLTNAQVTTSNSPESSTPSVFQVENIPGFGNPLVNASDVKESSTQASTETTVNTGTTIGILPWRTRLNSLNSTEFTTDKALESSTVSSSIETTVHPSNINDTLPMFRTTPNQFAITESIGSEHQESSIDMTTATSATSQNTSGVAHGILNWWHHLNNFGKTESTTNKDLGSSVITSTELPTNGNNSNTGGIPGIWPWTNSHQFVKSESTESSVVTSTETAIRNESITTAMPNTNNGSNETTITSKDQTLTTTLLPTSTPLTNQVNLNFEKTTLSSVSNNILNETTTLPSSISPDSITRISENSTATHQSSSETNNSSVTSTTSKSFWGNLFNGFSVETKNQELNETNLTTESTTATNNLTSLAENSTITPSTSQSSYFNAPNLSKTNVTNETNSEPTKSSSEELDSNSTKSTFTTPSVTTNRFNFGNLFKLTMPSRTQSTDKTLESTTNTLISKNSTNPAIESVEDDSDETVESETDSNSSEKQQIRPFQRTTTKSYSQNITATPSTFSVVTQYTENINTNFTNQSFKSTTPGSTTNTKKPSKFNLPESHEMDDKSSNSASRKTISRKTFDSDEYDQTNEDQSS